MLCDEYGGVGRYWLTARVVVWAVLENIDDAGNSTAIHRLPLLQAKVTLSNIGKCQLHRSVVTAVHSWHRIYLPTPPELQTPPSSTALFLPPGPSHNGYLGTQEEPLVRS